MSVRPILFVAALLLALAVATGAFGAHALKARLTPELMDVYHTAVQYHFGHAVGLLAIAALMMLKPDSGALAVAAWIIVGGIVLFSGSLYALALSGVRGFGAITPLGGVAFIAGWLTVAWAAWK